MNVYGFFIFWLQFSEKFQVGSGSATLVQTEIKSARSENFSVQNMNTDPYLGAVTGTLKRFQLKYR